MSCSCFPKQIDIAVGPLDVSGRASVEAQAAEMFADCGIEELRRIAAVVRTHTIGMMLSAASMAGLAERVEAIADLRTLMTPDADAVG